MVLFITTIIDIIFTISDIIKRRKIYKVLDVAIKENIRLLDMLIEKEKNK